jgi:NAD(P)-dependent dehydrogenase (short-subunit alcohol dehydrogenase family)
VEIGGRETLRLRDRVAIVTGAGSGIGRAIAERLSQEGSAVIVADIDPGGDAVAEELSAAGGRARFVRTDVSREADMRAAVKAAVSAYGRLDILVNNAGVNFSKPFLETTLDDWERVIGVDLRGAFLGCLCAIDRFVAQGGDGCIVNISSVHSAATIAGAAPYAAAKGGVSALTRALAVEFGQRGIRVNAVCPGSIATRIWDDAVAAAPDPEKFIRTWSESNALGRVGTPHEVAALVAWLCTDEAGYVTGADFFVDGGMTAMLTSQQREG